jgi:hypothetical protein
MSEESPSKEPEKRKRGPRVWHEQQEKILKTWGEASSCYRYMHMRAFQKYKKQSMNFTLPIIVISTVTGTANFAQSIFPPAWVSYVPLVIGAFNLIAAIMTTVLQFLKVNELMESHRVTSIQYGKLARNIRLELAMPLTERKHDGYNMVEICRAEYDRLIEQSPAVPKGILATFEDDIKSSSSSVIDSSNTFTRPEILTVKPIELFDREGEEERLREKHMKQLENLKRERDLRVLTIRPPNGGAAAPPLASPKRNLIDEIESLSNKRLVSRFRPGGCFTMEDEEVSRVNSTTGIPTRPASPEQIEIDIPPEEQGTPEVQEEEGSEQYPQEQTGLHAV